MVIRLASRVCENREVRASMICEKESDGCMKKSEITLTEIRAMLELMFRTGLDPVASAQVARAIVDIDKQRDMRRMSRKAMKTLDEMFARYRKENGDLA